MGMNWRQLEAAESAYDSCFSGFSLQPHSSQGSSFLRSNKTFALAIFHPSAEVFFDSRR